VVRRAVQPALTVTAPHGAARGKLEESPRVHSRTGAAASTVLRKAGGQSHESSDCRRGAYAVGPAEAACALYAATMASLSTFAAPLPPSIGLKKSK
jgi:hypothetical protein